MLELSTAVSHLVQDLSYIRALRTRFGFSRIEEMAVNADPVEIPIFRNVPLGMNSGDFIEDIYEEGIDVNDVRLSRFVLDVALAEVMRGACGACRAVARCAVQRVLTAILRDLRDASPCPSKGTQPASRQQLQRRERSLPLAESRGVVSSFTSCSIAPCERSPASRPSTSEDQRPLDAASDRTCLSAEALLQHGRRLAREAADQIRGQICRGCAERAEQRVRALERAWLALVVRSFRPGSNASLSTFPEDPHDSDGQSHHPYYLMQQKIVQSEYEMAWQGCGPSPELGAHPSREREVYQRLATLWVHGLPTSLDRVVAVYMQASAPSVCRSCSPRLWHALCEAWPALEAARSVAWETSAPAGWLDLLEAAARRAESLISAAAAAGSGADGGWCPACTPAVARLAAAFGDDARVTVLREAVASAFATQAVDGSASASGSAGVESRGARGTMAVAPPPANTAAMTFEDEHQHFGETDIETEVQPEWDSTCPTCQHDLVRFAGFMRSLVTDAEARRQQGAPPALSGLAGLGDAFLQQVVEEAASLAPRHRSISPSSLHIPPPHQHPPHPPHSPHPPYSPYPPPSPPASPLPFPYPTPHQHQHPVTRKLPPSYFPFPLTPPNTPPNQMGIPPGVPAYAPPGPPPGTLTTKQAHAPSTECPDSSTYGVQGWGVSPFGEPWSAESGVSSMPLFSSEHFSSKLSSVPLHQLSKADEGYSSLAAAPSYLYSTSYSEKESSMCPIAMQTWNAQMECCKKGSLRTARPRSLPPIDSGANIPLQCRISASSLPTDRNRCTRCQVKMPPPAQSAPPVTEGVRGLFPEEAAAPTRAHTAPSPGYPTRCERHACRGRAVPRTPAGARNRHMTASSTPSEHTTASSLPSSPLESLEVAETMVQSMKGSELDRGIEARDRTDLIWAKSSKSRKTKCGNCRSKRLDTLEKSFTYSYDRKEPTEKEKNRRCLCKEIQYDKEVPSLVNTVEKGTNTFEVEDRWNSVGDFPRCRHRIECLDHRKKKQEKCVVTDFSSCPVHEEIGVGDSQYRTVSTNVPSTHPLQNVAQIPCGVSTQQSTCTHASFQNRYEEPNIQALENVETRSPFPGTLIKDNKILLIIPKPRRVFKEDEKCGVCRQNVTTLTTNSPQQSYEQIEACLPEEFHVTSSILNSNVQRFHGDAGSTVNTECREAGVQLSSVHERVISAATEKHSKCDHISLCIPRKTNVSRNDDLPTGVKIISPQNRHAAHCGKQANNFENENLVGAERDPSLLHLLHKLPEPTRERLKKYLSSVVHDDQPFYEHQVLRRGNADLNDEQMAQKKSAPGHQTLPEKRDTVGSFRDRMRSESFANMNEELERSFSNVSDTPGTTDIRVLDRQPKASDMRVILPPRDDEKIRIEQESHTSIPLMEDPQQVPTDMPVETIWDGSKIIRKEEIQGIDVNTSQEDIQIFVPIVDPEGRVAMVPTTTYSGSKDAHEDETGSKYSIVSVLMRSSSKDIISKSQMSPNKPAEPMHDPNDDKPSISKPRDKSVDKEPVGQKAEGSENKGQNSTKGRDSKRENGRREKRRESIENAKEESPKRKSLNTGELLSPILKAQVWDPVRPSRKKETGQVFTRTGVDHTALRDTALPPKKRTDSREVRPEILHTKQRTDDEGTNTPESGDKGIMEKSESVDGGEKASRNDSNTKVESTESDERSFYSAPSDTESEPMENEKEMIGLQYTTEDADDKEPLVDTIVKDIKKQSVPAAIEAITDIHSMKADIDEALATDAKFSEQPKNRTPVSSRHRASVGSGEKGKKINTSDGRAVFSESKGEPRKSKSPKSPGNLSGRKQSVQERQRNPNIHSDPIDEWKEMRMRKSGEHIGERKPPTVNESSRRMTPVSNNPDINKGADRNKRSSKEHHSRGQHLTEDRAGKNKEGGKRHSERTKHLHRDPSNISYLTEVHLGNRPPGLIPHTKSSKTKKLRDTSAHDSDRDTSVTSIRQLQKALKHNTEKPHLQNTKSSGSTSTIASFRG